MNNKRQFVALLSRKFIFLTLSLFCVATLTFFLMHAIPGDPFLQEQAIPEEILKSMYRHYGLDKPLLVQFGHYLKNLIMWDLGPSFNYEGRSVNSIIANGFPISLTLGCEALFLAIGSGLLLGSLSAAFRSLWQDHVAVVVSAIGISLPNFLIATLLQFLLAMKLPILPIARWESVAHTILPALSIAALPTAFIARLTRSSMIEVLQQDFILTARAKGLSIRQVIFRHVLRNALLPVVTYLGPLTASVITGSFVVEKIFAIPGLGQWFVSSVSNRDYTVILGITVFYSAFLMTSVFLVDILYCLIDPRIRLQGGRAGK
jgi:oligopeptide transport system permease protein